MAGVNEALFSSIRQARSATTPDLVWVAPGAAMYTPPFDASFGWQIIESWPSTCLPVLSAALTCAAALEKVLVGRTMSDEPVAKVEARYKSLGVKNLGGYEVSDTLFLGFWQVCGDEFAILQAGAQVKAALKTGKHVDGQDSMICHPKDASKGGVYIAAPGATHTKSGVVAERAWRIDEQSASFTPAMSDALECGTD